MVKITIDGKTTEVEKVQLSLMLPENSVLKSLRFVIIQNSPHMAAAAYVWLKLKA